jgi:hypothetical protein
VVGFGSCPDWFSGCFFGIDAHQKSRHGTGAEEDVSAEDDPERRALLCAERVFPDAWIRFVMSGWHRIRFDGI